MKEVVAKALADRVQNGDVIGVGTGTTVDATLAAIGKRVQAEKLNIQVVPTSYQSAWQCQELGFSVLSPGFRGELAWGFDGADAVDKNLWLIKGKGGAMLKEKIMAAKCKKYFVVVDDSKIVTDLAKACPIPVEVIPEALGVAEKGLKSLGVSTMQLRPAVGKHGPIITEAGNLILDVTFPAIEAGLESRIKSVVGVVESGLFMGYATEVLVGSATGIKSLKL